MGIPLGSAALSLSSNAGAADLYFMATLLCSICGNEYPSGDAPVSPGAACPECERRMCESATGAIPKTTGDSLLCGICLSPIAEEEAAVTCPACKAGYHEECWGVNEGCAVYGCSQTPHAEQRTAVEIPVSFWGRENKPCPSCGRVILAAAIRCRFCGAVFASAQPEDASAFNQRSEREKRLPQVRRTIVWFFVLSVIPCLAPIGGVWGLVWFPRHRSDVDALPSLYSALCKIGIAVGLGQAVLMTLLTIIYALTQG